MKTITFGTIMIASLALAAPSVLMAGDDGSGFHGSLAINIGLSSGRPSQLEVAEDNEIVEGTSLRAARETEVFPIVSGHIGYRIAETGTDIVLDGEGDNRGKGLALSVNQPLGDPGNFKAAVFFDQYDVWKNPYLFNTKRSRTDQTTAGFELVVEDIFTSGAFVGLSYADIDVDEDVIGMRESDLRRDGERLTLHGGYAFPLTENSIITPWMAYEREEIEGRGNANDRYLIGIEYAQELGRWGFLSNVAYGYRSFDASHPVFGRSREENEFTVSGLVSFKEPFGIKGVSIYQLVAYSKADDDIDFFDSEYVAVVAGVKLDW